MEFNPLDAARRESDYKLTYVAPGEKGTVWNLATPNAAERADQAVLLLKDGTPNFDAHPALTTRFTVNRFGEDSVSAQLPRFGSTIKCLVGRPGDNLREVDRAWRQSWPLVLHKGELPTYDPWNPTKSGRFIITDTGGHNRWLPVYSTGMTSLPSNYRGVPSYVSDVEWESLAGSYFGSKKVLKGSGDITVPGDIRPIARLRWDTSALSIIQMPTGQALTLEPGPGVTGIRYINLNRGYAGQITDAVGNVDDVSWSQLRGAVLGINLVPHEPTTWGMSQGLQLEVIPRYLSPWR